MNVGKTGYMETGRLGVFPPYVVGVFKGILCEGRDWKKHKGDIRVYFSLSSFNLPSQLHLKNLLLKGDKELILSRIVTARTISSAIRSLRSTRLRQSG